MKHPDKLNRNKANATDVGTGTTKVHVSSHVKSLKSTSRLSEKIIDSSYSPYRSSNNTTLKKPETGPKQHILNLGHIENSILKDSLVQTNPSKPAPYAQSKYPKNILLEKLSLSNKINYIHNLFSNPGKVLKNLELNSELDYNFQVFYENSEYKPNTWIDNLINLKEKSKKSNDLINDLKFSNHIFRDLMCRMKGTGKENEGILVEKLWRFVLEVFDNYIELIQDKINLSDIANKNSVKAQEEIEKIKLGCQLKVSKLEKEIERIKLDYILAKDPRKMVQDEKMQNLIPSIERIKEYINKISDMHCGGMKDTIYVQDPIVQHTPRYELRARLKEKHKKSMEVSLALPGKP
jgi:hypothetical protein